MTMVRTLSFVLAALAAVTLAIAAEWPTARLGSRAHWDTATDLAGQQRFIPMQLVVPGVWDGEHRIDMPSADGDDVEGTKWSGPGDWKNPHTGQTMRVYDRRRSNRREGSVEQKMAIRADGAAIGRAYDSRFGGLVCDGEAKFPLGVWKQGEVRTFDYVCLTTRGGRVVETRRSARITIEALDYEYQGTPHSLRFAWRFSDRDTGEVLDHRTYVFSPGFGLVAHLRR